MRVALVDHLVCPRCGPPFGLILLALDVRDRRIERGEFGCPNCRDRFPVENGFGDLRPPPRAAPPPRPPEDGSTLPGADPSQMVALAAALGVGEGAGWVVLPDSCLSAAVALARQLPALDLVVVGWGGRGLADSHGRISALVTGQVLPLTNGVARGAVVGQGESDEWRTELLRVLMPGGRLVFPAPSEESRQWVRAAGLTAIVDERDWMVAVRAPRGAEPGVARWSP